MKRKREVVTKLVHPDKPWTPWQVMNTLIDADGQAVDIPPGVLVVSNNQYEVQLRRQVVLPPFDEVTWLSIKRRDRRVIRDWRDLQRIKNELVGREVEAVELFPAESRLVDTANQFHLWAFTSGWKAPFGFEERLVLDDSRTENPMLRKARQRPFRPGEAPADIRSANDPEVIAMAQRVKLMFDGDSDE